jgi:5-carboxymethyl-2-hydroxymuconate isomerase
MPHLIVEHSSDIRLQQIKILQTKIQDIMPSVAEGNFDPDQCKCRSLSFDEYLVGRPDQATSSFIHVTIKILSGRTPAVKKKLAEESMRVLKEFFGNLATKPNEKDRIVETAHELADAITGVPHVQLTSENSDFANKRCDLSVDIVDMDRDSYQKIRIGN